MNLDGSFVREMTIPEYHRPQENIRGFRSDCGYQGLTISPDGNRLYAVTCQVCMSACPLIGQQFAPEGGNAVNMLVYDISGT